MSAREIIKIVKFDLCEFDDEQLLADLTEREIYFQAWDDKENLLASNLPAMADMFGMGTKATSLPAFIVASPPLDEAIARLHRGETLEAILHLERAIPALSGLETAVRNLAKDPSR